MAKPPTPNANTTLRDPHEWKTGDEPITAAQRSYLETLLREAGEDLPEDIDRITKAEAALRIDDLQQKTGRGNNDTQSSH
jgi:hypothetical protein